MITLVLTAVPGGLRGDLTKWLLEISPGVFVGRLTSRVRDYLWGRVLTECRDGRALLVYSTDSEQRLAFRSHNHDWTPRDYDGLLLMTRPAAPPPRAQRTGWSAARNQQRARDPQWARSRAEDAKLELDSPASEQNT